MTVVGGTDTCDRPFANWTNGQLLLLVLTLLISIFVINFLLLALQVCLPGDRWWDMQIAIFANPKVLSPRPQLTANSLTSVGGTDACDQLCYWDSKDPWAQCHIIDYLSLLGPSGHFRYCDQLSSTSTDCKFIDFSGWDWCLWSALLLGPKGPLSSAAHCWSSFTTLFFQGVPLVINCLLLASTGPLPAASLGRHASLNYSSCITQVALLKLHYSSCITQVALLKLQY